VIDFGIVKPGTTLYVPFHTFDSNDPSASVTLTGLAVTDIEIYKNGSVTQRASDTGYALLDTDGIDFDGITGIHGFSINLASNATAGFFSAGAQYWVVVSSVTVDAATINFVAATFRIGYPDAILNTTIATLSSQTSFTLTDGPAENSALLGCPVLIHDVASAVQLGFAVVSAYTGSTKTVTLTAGVSFTAAATDNISFFPPVNTRWIGAVLPASATIGTVTTTTTATNLTNAPTNGDLTATMKTSVTTAATAATPTAAAVTGAVGSVTGNVGGNVTGSVGSVLGGINTSAGVITTLDALDTAQDTQHGTTQSAISTAQADLDILTGTDGVTLATAQANYAPAVAGNQMDLVNAPNATAVTAIQNGLSTHTAADAADAVWEELIADHSATSGSTAEQLAAAGAAGDPWATALPGTYTAGQAGKIVGDNINATVSSRMPTTHISATGGAVDNVTLVDTTTTNTDMRGTDSAATAASLATAQTAITAIKTKTDSLTFTKAGEVDSNLQSVNDVTVNGDGSGTPMGV